MLGTDHPNTVLNRYRLGDVLQAQGQLEQAEAEYHVAAETDWLGADHPNTMIARHKLADVLRKRGDLNAASRSTVSF